MQAKIFFAPAHTFDKNTLKAIKETTDIRIISDTVANDIYYKNEMYFIPQQSGTVRTLPFKVVTFCYHPNTMDDVSFDKLETFLKLHVDEFGVFSTALLKKQHKTIYDRTLQVLYRMRNLRKLTKH